MQRRIFGCKWGEETGGQKCIMFGFAICIRQVALLRAIKTKRLQWVDVQTRRMHEKVRNVKQFSLGRPQKKKTGRHRRGENNKNWISPYRIGTCFDLAQYKDPMATFVTKTLNQPFFIWGPLMPKGAVDRFQGVLKLWWGKIYNYTVFPLTSNWKLDSHSIMNVGNIDIVL